MKKYILFFIFLVFIVLITLFDRGLSFTRTGGEDFESITPIVKSNLELNDILEMFENKNNAPIIENKGEYTKISINEFNLQTWHADIEYFLGNKLSEELLHSNNFPNLVESNNLNVNHEKIIAVKIKYLDLTKNGMNSLKEILLKAEKLELKSEKSGNYFFLYDEYTVLLIKDTIYFYLNKE